MHVLAVRRTRDNLHGPCAVVAPTAGFDLAQTTAAGGKKRCLPAKKPGCRDRPVILPGGVQHHFHHAFHVAIRRFERANVHAQPAGNG